MPRAALSYILPLIIGTFLGVSFLYYFSTLIIPDQNFEESALGEENTATFSLIDQVEVHCSHLGDAQRCISGYNNFGKNNEVVLWLGNSQLHAINQIKEGDELSSAIMHRGLKTEQKYLLTFSQPNANLQEHYLLFEYLAKSLPLSTLILAVVFDDLRETGIRDQLTNAFNNKAVSMEMKKTDIGRSLSANHGGKNAALYNTLQKQSEKYLNRHLEKIWSIWKDRPTFRGNVLGKLYLFRNWIFGIKPSSVRRMMQGRYNMNIKALNSIVHSANKQGINVLVYIVPLRGDVTIPYDLVQYEKFKSDVELIVNNGFAQFANLEELVPGNLWGTKASTTLGGEEELDFMHFKAGGHRLLAGRIFSELKRVWEEEKK